MGSTTVEREELNIRERGIDMGKEVFLSMEAEIDSEPAELLEGV